MTEHDDFTPRPEEEAEQETVPFVPSPVSRRIWAWMGVIYVLLILVLLTYWIATTRFITGITGLLLFPVLGALCAQGINNFYRARRGEHSGTPALLLTTALLMGLLALSALVWGIFQAVAFAKGGGI